MRVQRAVGTDGWVVRRRDRWPLPQWPLHRDLLAVATICVILGLQIVVVMTSAGGPEAFSAVASEGMQFPP
jgi:hypothetical protein